MQGLFFKMFAHGIDIFSTVINRDMNKKVYLCGDKRKSSLLHEP